MKLLETVDALLSIQKLRRVAGYIAFTSFLTFLNFTYVNNTTRAGYSRADQYYAEYPSGVQILFDSPKLYKSAIGNCFEIDDWGPVEYLIMSKHYERQGKSPYSYHARYMAHLLSLGQVEGSSA